MQPSFTPEPAKPRRNADLALRLWSSLVLIPVSLLGAWWGGPAAYALAAIVAAIVFAEWATIVGRSPSIWPSNAETALGTAFVVLAALLAGLYGVVIGLCVMIAGALVALALSRSFWLALGSLYAGLLGVSLAALRADPAYGLTAIVVLLVVVWGTDSIAYFAGRGIGGPKLWPRVSPKKTWSGSIGGLIGGVALALIAPVLLGVPVGWKLVALLVGLSLVSQIGDLVESALKRLFDKKDSSTIIPGHGGMMDRVDGLIFAGAAAMLVGWAHAGPAEIGRGMLLW
ncbi:phosphatidate cytidylyltransferase [Kaistia dalseonensis]|uniref:phosphatidate cytidylyltransferase n=1 Tax=Kaistia dalseonensis TaxID=410840 RepID=UPI0022573B13|nr:phosphatidate cytidylyltransferase [Kaistia dalseonensis]MCX5493425.1 phosphatidate cytidylyltransferase [Kaistia dalseonensis]